VPKVKVGQLGAILSKDASGFFKIDKILRGQNWTGRCARP
jgi:hypothetical protein